MICVARACRGASGSVTAITIANAAPSAPDENHLCPSITHSSPSRTARVRSSVGSEPATSGSVIEKNERISPGDERREPALLLLVGAELPEDLGVAGVGRLAAEDVLRPRRAADLLVEVGVREEAGARAAGLGREVRRPQAVGLRALAQRVDELERGVVLARDRRLVRGRRAPP